MADRFVPHLLITLGLLIGAAIAGQLVAMSLSASPPNLLDLFSAATSVPFVAILVGGGYWLLKGGLPPSRHRRLAGWTVAGLVFTGSFFLLVALEVSSDPLVAIGIFRWGAAAGSGGGLLVGLFEGRAIERAVATERSLVRAEELRRQNDRLGEFASIIAHDIRNPLNVATGYLELAREDDGHDDDKLRRVAGALDRVERILEETLTLARSGQVIGEAAAVDLESLGRRSWRHVETPAAELRHENPPVVRADADRLEHLLENLFRNAVEHGGDGVTVEVGRLADGFYIEDDGPGIPEDEREDVLEAGYSTGGSTGFGLAIVSQIAHAHGWQLAITDGSDGGARFEFTNVEIVDSAPDAETPGGQVSA